MGPTPSRAARAARTERPGQPAGKRERNKRDKLARIAAAAGELFRAQGFEATTGRQICERAGIATGTLFLYVQDKRELLFLIFRPLAERTLARQPAGLREDERVVDGLMRLFGALLRMYGRDPQLSRLFVQEMLFRPAPSEGRLALTAELEARVAAIVVDGCARGELRAQRGAARLGAVLLAHYVFWLQLWLGTGAVGRRAAERGLRTSLELSLEGIGRARR